MTTKVTIEAHCDDDHKVKVTMHDGHDFTEIPLYRGEKFTVYLSKDKELKVREVPLEAPSRL